MLTWLSVWVWNEKCVLVKTESWYSWLDVNRHLNRSMRSMCLTFEELLKLSKCTYSQAFHSSLMVIWNNPFFFLTSIISIMGCFFNYSNFGSLDSLKSHFSNSLLPVVNILYIHNRRFLKKKIYSPFIFLFFIYFIEIPTTVSFPPYLKMTFLDSFVLLMLIS